jgi:hypothetical protein
VIHLDYLDIDESGHSGRPNGIREVFFFSELLDPPFSRLSPFAAISRITADKHNKEARKHGKGS